MIYSSQRCDGTWQKSTTILRDPPISNASPWRQCVKLTSHSALIIDSILATIIPIPLSWLREGFPLKTDGFTIDFPRVLKKKEHTDGFSARHATMSTIIQLLPNFTGHTISFSLKKYDNRSDLVWEACRLGLIMHRATLFNWSKSQIVPVIRPRSSTQSKIDTIESLPIKSPVIERKRRATQKNSR